MSLRLLRDHWLRNLKPLACVACLNNIFDSSFSLSRSACFGEKSYHCIYDIFVSFRRFREARISWISTVGRSFVNTDTQYERLIQRWPILNNVPFMCPLLWSFVSSLFHPPSHLAFPAVRQLQVSLSGKFYLQLNSAPPPIVAGSTGSALLSIKQTVNSRFVPQGCDTSTTHCLNMFLHGAANREKGGFIPLLQFISRKGSCSWLSEHFLA